VSQGNRRGSASDRTLSAVCGIASTSLVGGNLPPARAANVGLEFDMQD